MINLLSPHLCAVCVTYISLPDPYKDPVKVPVFTPMYPHFTDKESKDQSC